MKSGKMPELWLDGMDYAAAYLAWECRNTPGTANHFIVKADGCFDLESSIAELPENVLRLLHGRMRRNLFHAAPFWKPGKPFPLKFRKENLSVTDYLNLPLPPHTVLECCTSEHGLLFKFDHRLFDGQGAEFFISALLERDFSKLEKITGEPGPHLNEWRFQFDSGKRMQRPLIEICHSCTPARLPLPPKNASALTHIIVFSPEETKRFKENAVQAAGPYMITPFLLGIIAFTLRKYFRNNGPVVVPMTSDLRTGDSIYFNHWGISTLFADGNTQDSLIRSFRKSFIENLSSKRANDFSAAARLARIAPFRLMSFIARKIGPALTGSFMFSCIPETRLKSEAVINLVHIPAMPVVCGCGVFVNFFRNQMNVTVSLRENVLPESFVMELETALKGFAR